MSSGHPEDDHALRLPCPSSFLFGAATAAFQIEGATHTDGRTDSIWDTFCRVPGAVINGDDGSGRVRSLPPLLRRRRADEASSGSAPTASRSSWPRVRPRPRRRSTPQGIAFYDSPRRRASRRGIEPWLTLYHWDLPQELEDAGGWANRDTAYRFAEYALTCTTALGDRVRRWTTLNEPWCSAFLGYAAGAHAPGRQEPARPIAAGPPPAARPRPRRRGAACGQPRARRSASRSTSRSSTRSTRRTRRRRRRAPHRRAAQPVLPRPAAARRATRTDVVADLARHLAVRPRSRRRSRHDRRARSTSSA